MQNDQLEPYEMSLSYIGEDLARFGHQARWNAESGSPTSDGAERHFGPNQPIRQNISREYHHYRNPFKHQRGISEDHQSEQTGQNLMKAHRKTQSSCSQNQTQESLCMPQIEKRKSTSRQSW